MAPQTDALSRRKFLTLATVGGLAVTASALGGAALGGNAVRDTAEAELAQARARLQKYAQLIALYEQLEKVGLDTLIATGMNIARGAFDAIRNGIQIIRAGITTAENALASFQSTLLALRGVADTVARAATELLQKFKFAESIVTAFLGSALPLAESIANFFATLLGKIPIVGDDLRRAVNALAELVRAIPTLLDALLNQLLRQLRELFFPLAGASTTQTTLFDPLTQSLLTPLKKFLGDVESALARWENDFVKPVQAALDARAQIRKEIAQLYQESGLV